MQERNTAQALAWAPEWPTTVQLSGINNISSGKSKGTMEQESTQKASSDHCGTLRVETSKVWHEAWTVSWEHWRYLVGDSQAWERRMWWKVLVLSAQTHTNCVSLVRLPTIPPGFTATGPSQPRNPIALAMISPEVGQSGSSWGFFFFFFPFKGRRKGMWPSR